MGAFLKPIAMRNIATKEGSSYDKKLDQLKIKYSSTMKVMIAKQKRSYGCKSAEYKKNGISFISPTISFQSHQFPPNIVSPLCCGRTNQSLETRLTSLNLKF